MTEAELTRLLDVARRRPLLDALTVRRGKRKGEAYANVRPEVRNRLEALGRERALIYKTLVLTGLRKNELATLTVAQLRLDGPTASRSNSTPPTRRTGKATASSIRADLADDLPHWLDDKLAALQAEARRRGEPIPARLPADTPVFDVPDGLVRIFDRDLKLAGIAKRDERGRTLDVHALRTTFGTLLSKGGVPLADGSSRDAAFRPEPDGERLHRPEAARRARGPRRLAEPSPRRGRRTPKPSRATGTGTDRARIPLHHPLHRPGATRRQSVRIPDKDEHSRASSSVEAARLSEVPKMSRIRDDRQALTSVVFKSGRGDSNP